MVPTLGHKGWVKNGPTHEAHKGAGTRARLRWGHAQLHLPFPTQNNKSTRMQTFARLHKPGHRRTSSSRTFFSASCSSGVLKMASTFGRASGCTHRHARPSRDTHTRTPWRDAQGLSRASTPQDPNTPEAPHTARGTHANRGACPASAPLSPPLPPACGARVRVWRASEGAAHRWDRACSVRPAGCSPTNSRLPAAFA